MTMEIKYFRLIKTIVEEGSLANSSERLFLTQSALSHQLRELEERLGFRVFHRSRNNWQLTEEGTELYKMANRLLDTLSDGFNNIREIREGSRGTIRLSTECYSFYQGIPNFVQRMAALYPEIHIELIMDATHQPIAKILTNDIDVAIVSSPPETEQLIAREIFQDEVFAIMHKEHPLGNREFLSATDFSEVQLIIHSFPLETVTVYEHFLKPNNVMPEKVIAVPFTELSLELVNANMGITCMPRWALHSFKISEDLVFRRIGKNGLRRTHYLVIRAADRDKKYIDDFIRSFEEEIVRKG